VNDADTHLWHPWLRSNRVLRVMLHPRWSAEAWPCASGASATLTPHQSRRAGDAATPWHATQRAAWEALKKV
jgi:hypothetical protein